MTPRRRVGFRVPEQLLLPWSPKSTISALHAAQLLDVSLQTVCRMIEDGSLKAYKMRPDKVNSPWRVNYDSVIAHVEKLHAQNGLEKRF
jgi:excisionase family DNA binding protein